MATGIVKWFNHVKEYGFIAVDNGGGDIFVHARQVEDRDGGLAQGQRVQFQIENSPKGKCAARVRVLEP